MIESYQERQRLEAEPAKREVLLATVVGTHADGLTLQVDGETTPSSKRYKRNLSITFAVGQRVKLCRIGKTYIVEYPYG